MSTFRILWELPSTTRRVWPEASRARATGLLKPKARVETTAGTEGNVRKRELLPTPYENSAGGGTSCVHRILALMLHAELPVGRKAGLLMVLK
jgi:hypothetical protein